MEDIFEKAGKSALGSRLRRLSERMTDQAGSIYQLYGNDFQPRWFPVYYALMGGQEKAISTLAQEIGQSHASISQIVKEMGARGQVKETKDKEDGRRNLISLSEKGVGMEPNMTQQIKDVELAVENMMKETSYDLWKAIQEWEFLLDQKDLLRRVLEVRRDRESAQVRIIDYTPAYQPAFKTLNERWISQYFKMEETDYKSLDHPQTYILDKGGHIFIALLDNQPVGCVAMIPMDAHTHELAKMAVAPEAQGKHIGWLLGQAAIEWAKNKGLDKIYLESNTRLKPAINLYYKLGFERITGIPSPYERCNIQMMLHLK